MPSPRAPAAVGAPLQLAHSRTVLPAGAAPARVSALAWCPQGARLAAAGADRVVSLIDAAGERRDRFATKPATGDKATYAVTALAFAPDAQRLAVAQSDGIVFVYSLGATWGDKKAIVGRSVTAAAAASSGGGGAASPATAVCWPESSPAEPVLGDGEGRLCLCRAASGRAAVALRAGGGGGGGSRVLTLAVSRGGRGIAVGYADGGVRVLSLDAVALSRLAVAATGSSEEASAAAAAATASASLRHACAPRALAWAGAAAVLVAGSDGRVCLYASSGDGALLTSFDSGSVGGAPQLLTAAAASPSGDAVAVGGFDRVLLYCRDGSGAGVENWRAARGIAVPGLASVTALAWSADGSGLAAGSLCGAVDLFDAYQRRTHCERSAADVLVTSASVVVVATAAGPRRLVLRAGDGAPLQRVRLHAAGRFASAQSARGSLLLGEVATGRAGEVPPAASGGDGGILSPPLCVFEHAPLAWVHRAGELVVVQLGGAAAGAAPPLATLRASCASAHTVDILLLPAPRPALVAYTSEPTKACVAELGGGRILATLAHSACIEWLALCASGTRLLLRDASQLLLLCDMAATVAGATSAAASVAAPSLPAGAVAPGAPQEAPALRAVPLLSACAIAQWLPGDSNAVAAQQHAPGGGMGAAPPLSVWYTTAAPALAHVAQVHLGGQRADTIVEAGSASAAGAAAVLLLSDTPAAEHCGKAQAVLLDGNLLTASAAVERGELAQAAATLSATAVSETAGARGIWAALGAAAEDRGDLDLAARAAAAIGDESRAHFLQRAAAAAAAAAVASPAAAAATACAAVQQLRGELAAAEASLLARDVDGQAAARLYADMGEWEPALAVADAHCSAAAAAALRDEAAADLRAAGCDARAAALRESEGDFAGAVELLLRAGMPARAAALAGAQPTALTDDVLARVMTALLAAGLFARAGALAERLDCGGVGGRALATGGASAAARALECYMRGGAWRQAVDLARRVAPERVVDLELAWGRALRSGDGGCSAAPAAAVAHLLEAGAPAEAAAAAAEAGQFLHAADIVADALRGDVAAAAAQYRRLAAAAVAAGAVADAEALLLLRARDGAGAVRMHLAAGRTADALRVARMPEAALGEGEVAAIFAAAGAPVQHVRLTTASTGAAVPRSPPSTALPLPCSTPVLAPSPAQSPGRPPTGSGATITVAPGAPSAAGASALSRMTELLDVGSVNEAAILAHGGGVPATAASLPELRRLARAVLAGDDDGGAAATLELVRAALYDMAAALHAQPAVADGGIAAEFDRLLLPLHYAALRARLQAATSDAAAPSQAAELAARLAVAMLRFAGGPLWPADRAFFQAGAACRRVGWRAAAVVFLNRYVDICDAIDEAAAAGAPAPALARLGNAEFAGTGIPPPPSFEPQPARHHVAPRAARDEARRWLLEQARAAPGAAAAEPQRLPRRPCFACGEPLFEAALGCPACLAAFPACVASGYPIPASQATTCHACGSAAIRTHWATALRDAGGVCPWCRAAPTDAAVA